MSPIEKDQENKISCGILSLTLDDGHNSSNYSFSSSPDICRNKGAVEFMILVEKALEKLVEDESRLKFEMLVVEMLELTMDKTGDSR